MSEARAVKDSWLRVAVVALLVATAAAWMERYHPAPIYTGSCGVAGLTTSCGSVGPR